jgi:hypothetical protein
VLNVGLVTVGGWGSGAYWELHGGAEREHRLAPLVEGTGGILRSLIPPSVEDTDPELDEDDQSVEELVRPIRIDAPKLLAAGEEVAFEDVASEEMPAFLDEGASFTQWLRAPHAPGPLQLEGRLWSRTVRWSLASDGPLTRALPALMVNAPEGAAFHEGERAEAAEVAHVVGPGQSALAAFPGAGPMGLATDDLGGFGTGGGAIDIGCRARAAEGPATPNAGAWLARLLAPAAQRCGAGNVTLQVETTFREVVDVRVASAARPQATCLVEAAWALRLDERFEQAHGVFDVQPGAADGNPSP